MSEETPQLPVSEQVRQPADQIEAPSLLDKLKLQKKKILIGVGVFLGVLVLAGAAFGIYKYAQRQITLEPAGEPTSTLVATPTPDETANWKTYTNNFAKFSIKYPTFMIFEEKSLSDQEKQIIFTGPEGVITINAAVPESSGWGGGCDPEQKGEVEFLGNPTQACLIEEWLSQLYGQHPDGHSQVQISANFASPFSQNKEIILRALSTFRFLEVSETQNWKTHTNLENKYFFKYTPDWTISEGKYVNVSVTLNAEKIKHDLVNVSVRDDWTGLGGAQNQTKNLQVGGVSAYQKVSKEQPRQDLEFTTTYFEKDGKIFIFECIHALDQLVEEQCGQILSTFRFLE